MSKNPIYIFSPPFRESSAGIRVLHKLAIELGNHGHKVFLYWLPNKKINFKIGNLKKIKPLTHQIIDIYNKKKLSPIVIYPEIFRSSYFSGGVKVKYILSFNKYCEERDENIITFSKNILSKLKKREKKKCLSVFSLLDLNKSFCIRYDQIKKKRRDLITFYASKFEENYNQKIPKSFSKYIRITRDKITSQSKFEIRKLFLRSKVFYCFEESALAHEAIMCGCPVVFIESKNFKRPTVLSQELGPEMFYYEKIENIKKKSYQVKEINLNKKKIYQFSQKIKKLENLKKVDLNKFFKNISEELKNRKFKKFYINVKQVNLNSSIDNEMCNCFKIFSILTYYYNIILFYGFRVTLIKFLRRLLFLRFKNL